MGDPNQLTLEIINNAFVIPQEETRVQDELSSQEDKVEVLAK